MSLLKTAWTWVSCSPSRKISGRSFLVLMRLCFILGYLELRMSFFLQKVLVLRRWLARVDEKMLLATSLLPITTEEYSRSRCLYWGFINIIIPAGYKKSQQQSS